MKVVILGANGQLGAELVKALSAWDVYPLARPAFDVRDAAALGETLARIRPAVVVNTAAMTDVDGCEKDVAQAFEVNACGVRNVAGACAQTDAVLVHVTTDYVFDGGKRGPYQEDDAPHPLSVYGISKLAGEYFARNGCHRHLVIRTSGLYGAAGARGKGGNFVETMIRMAREGRPIRVVNDQVLTPTYARDVACAIKQLLLAQAYGVYHVANSGACSWYEFAGAILARAGLAPALRPITSAEWGAPARRPRYSVLATEKLASTIGSALRPWSAALDVYLAEKGYVQPRNGPSAAMSSESLAARRSGTPGT